MVNVQCPVLPKVTGSSTNDPTHALPKLPVSATTRASLGAPAVPDTTTVLGPLGFAGHGDRRRLWTETGRLKTDRHSGSFQLQW